MTTCIGCGCDDHNACQDDELTAGCHWLALDIDRGIGVCSACSELHSQWKDGRRKPNPEFTELRVQDLLSELYPRDDALAWYQAPHKQLAGKSPHDVVATGQIRKVRQVIDQLRAGGLIS